MDGIQRGLEHARPEFKEDRQTHFFLQLPLNRIKKFQDS